MANVTKWAASGAYLTHNHKGRRTAAKTFMQVRAGRLFTYSCHFMAAQNIFNLLHLRGRR